MIFRSKLSFLYWVSTKKLCTLFDPILIKHIKVIIIPTATFRVWYLYVFLGVCIFFQVFCMAYLVVASATLLSKFSPKDKQATIQGELINYSRSSTITWRRHLLTCTLHWPWIKSITRKCDNLQTPLFIFTLCHHENMTDSLKSLQVLHFKC